MVHQERFSDTQLDDFQQKVPAILALIHKVQADLDAERARQEMLLEELRAHSPLNRAKAAAFMVCHEVAAWVLGVNDPMI